MIAARLPSKLYVSRQYFTNDDDFNWNYGALMWRNKGTTSDVSRFGALEIPSRYLIYDYVAMEILHAFYQKFV